MIYNVNLLQSECMNDDEWEWIIMMKYISGGGSPYILKLAFSAANPDDWTQCNIIP